MLKIEDPLERSFYEKECENERWGVRELKRQMKNDSHNPLKNYRERNRLSSGKTL